MKKEIKNIYIAGAVTSDINDHGYLHCYQKFENAEKTVAKYFPGAKIYNPMKICKADWSWIRCMVVCLWVLIFKCDGAIFLDDYKSSKGAMIEFKCANRFLKLSLGFEDIVEQLSFVEMVNKTANLVQLVKIQLYNTLYQKKIKKQDEKHI